MSQKYPRKVDELPGEEFFAILTPTSVTIPGDERSRTNPGHGYPEHTVDHWEMEVFADKHEWEVEIMRRYSQQRFGARDFKAIRAIPAKIKREVKIEVDPLSLGGAAIW